MKKKNLPVYNIDHFTHQGNEHDFYTNTFAAHIKQHPFIAAAHKHDFYLVVYFTRGSGTHEVDFYTYDIKPGSVFLLSPGQVHNWILSEDIDGYIFFHSREFYELNFISEKVQNYPFYCSIYNSPLLLLKNEYIKKTEIIFQEILQEYQESEFEESKLMKYKKIKFLLGILYIDLSRIYLPQKQLVEQNHHYLAKVRKLEDLIEINFREVKAPGEYAKMIYMSEKHLNRICKECLDKTVSDLIADRIMLEAKRMLVHGRYPVGEVSAALGYLDHSYFSRLFKKKSGETPLAFIHKYQQNQ